MMNSLWGDDFVVEKKPPKAEVKKIIDKVTKPKVAKVTTTTKTSSKKAAIPLDEQLNIIAQSVRRILGTYAKNTQVIKTREELTAYIDAAIINGEIAIDTETNNSLDPLTCKLMGPCIYTPGQLNAYIPINHVDRKTGERLSWQLTEQDVAEEFSRLHSTNIIMHNGKFDYQVIKCTTGKQLKVYWDTLIATRILNENEKRANLKEQYIDKVDS